MRLIDKDALLDQLKELLKNKEEEAAYAGRRGSTVCWDDVIFTIKNAPTVEPETLSCGSGVDAENGTHLVGKTITVEDIDGFGIELKFTDGSVFTYSASDGGCSSWDFDPNEEDNNECID